MTRKIGAMLEKFQELRRFEVVFNDAFRCMGSTLSLPDIIDALKTEVFRLGIVNLQSFEIASAMPGQKVVSEGQLRRSYGIIAEELIVGHKHASTSRICTTTVLNAGEILSNAPICTYES